MNLPTKITVARIALIPVMLVAFCLREVFEYSYIIVTAIFIIASCTDFIDGHIARSRNLVTDLGKFLDPVADKILVAAGLILIIADGVLNIYFAVIGSVIILAREFIIGVFRQIAATKNCVLAADKLGKLKTIFTLIAISALLLAPMSRHSVQWVSILGKVFLWLGAITFGISVILTIWSGANYIVKNKGVLEENTEATTDNELTLCDDNTFTNDIKTKQLQDNAISDEANNVMCNKASEMTKVKKSQESGIDTVATDTANDRKVAKTAGEKKAKDIADKEGK